MVFVRGEEDLTWKALANSIDDDKGCVRGKVGSENKMLACRTAEPRGAAKLVDRRIPFAINEHLVFRDDTWPPRVRELERTVFAVRSDGLDFGVRDSLVADHRDPSFSVVSAVHQPAIVEKSSVVRIHTEVCGGFRSIQEHTPTWCKAISTIPEYWTLGRSVGGFSP